MNTKGKSMMRKLLGQPATSTANESVDRSRAGSPHLRPSASQNTVYSAGAPIGCLDRSPDGTRAVVAGPKVFKVLKIDGSTITEDIDLRAVLTSSSTKAHYRSAATSDQLNIGAVAWAPNTTIITASGNDRITVYDLNRAGDGLEVGRINDHSRQVHKLAVNPAKSTWLLSASQDGFVKSFDIREPLEGRNGAIFPNWKSFKCNADAVRDVKWNPGNGAERGYHFACCTDAGVVQQWDARKATQPVLRLAAHSGACSSISYHPDGNHLVSGGMDQFCRVWNVSSSAQRNQAPKYTFSTPASVSKVSWRPACWSATAQGKRAAQVTVSYDDSAPARNRISNVHIWDLARPDLPFKEVEQWEKAPAGFIWNSRDLLWSVDREGRFVQTDVAFIPKLIDKRSLSTFAFSSTGDVLMMLEERLVPRRRPSVASPGISPSFEQNSSGPLLGVSKSDSEEDVVGSFLGARPRKRNRRRNSVRSNQPLSTTPPSNTPSEKVMTLDDAVKVTGIYKPKQVMAIGHAPSTAKREMYQYFTNRYLQPMVDLKMRGKSTDMRMASIMESYARSAEKVVYFRLAQTWRLLAYTISLLLIRRAEYHRNQRLTVKIVPSMEDIAKEDMTESKTLTEIGTQTPRKSPRTQTPVIGHMHRHTGSIVTEDIESTSNVATPLVRAVRDVVAHQTREAMHTPMVEDDELKLPDPAVYVPPNPIPVPGAKQTSDVPSDMAKSSVEGYDFYGLESFSPKQPYAAPQRKQPLRLEYAEGNGSPSRAQPHRHDSGESFAMFSTSGESNTDRFMSSDGSDSYKEHNHDLRDRFRAWENSQPSDLKDRSTPSNAATRSEGSYQYTNTPDSGELHDSGMQSAAPQIRLQEASAPMVDTSGLPQATYNNKNNSSASSFITSEDPNVIESDFEPRPNDPAFLIRAMDPTVLVNRTLKFETQSGVLNAAAMVLLLRPFLPPHTINGVLAGAILQQYHHRLITLKLFAEAALLRNLCVPTYPDVFLTAQERVTVGYFCTDCNKPLENDPLTPNSQWKCPRCRKGIDGCAICHHQEIDEAAEYDTTNLAGWWVCAGCGHGGHTACMQAWHSGPEYEEGDDHSNGGCPLEGCLHPCLPGRWREKRAEEMDSVRRKDLDMTVRENSRSNSGRGGLGRSHPVRKDPREANQSKAVEGVRVALSGSSLAGTGGSGLERKKSVKLVAPGEER